jgi:hypothetical protein
MNSREMVGEFRSLRQALSGRLDSATLSLLIAGISAQDHALGRSQKLCHNCDTKPVLAAQIDFFDELRLLILRNLLKTQICPKIPAYRLIRHTSIVIRKTIPARVSHRLSAGHLDAVKNPPRSNRFHLG